MDIKSCDKTVSRILRKRAKKDVNSNVSRNLQDNFNRAIQNIPQGNGETLILAFEVVSDYWNEAGRLSEPAYVKILNELLDMGFLESAVAVFTVCINSIVKIDFESLTTAMPTSSRIDIWLKQSKASKQTLLKSISDSCDLYYATAWCDWFMKKAPVKSLLPFARLALQGNKRPRYLPEPPDILMVMLARDRKFVLTKDIVKWAVQDALRSKELISVCSRVPGAAETYARNFGLVLVTEDGVCNLAHALKDLLRVRNTAQSQFSAQFAAHVATTWRLAVGARIPMLADVEKPLLGIGIDVLLFGQDSNMHDLWVASTTGTITEKMLTVKGKVSPQGAMQIALGLRAAQTDADALDALWSAAFNLGIREIGKVGTVVQFDPILHEDIRGGLLRGDDARVVRCGWEFGEDVLLRSQVEPA